MDIKSSKKLARGTETGNALWFILLAIALLAALTVTISRSSDTTEQTGNVERQRIQASDVMRYAVSIQQTVDQMRLRGLSESDISFENSFISGGYINPNCNADNSCLVFHREGGGLVYQSPSAQAGGGEWLFTGANRVSGVGTTANELLIMLPGIDQSLCSRINTELGISGIPSDLLRSNITVQYTGAFPAAETIDEPAGKKSGCYEGALDENGTDITGTYYFYHTLIVR